MEPRAHDLLIETGADPDAYDQDPTGGIGHHAVHSAKWSLLDKWSSRILSLVTFSLLGRLLLPAQFGIIAMAATVITLLGLFADTGVSEALVQRDVLNPGVIDTAFWLSTGVGSALSLLCFALAGPAAHIYKQPQLMIVLQVMSLTILIETLASVQESLLQREFRFRALAFRNLFASVFGAAVGISWAVISPTVWALVASWIATSVATTVAMWFTTRYRPKLRFDTTEAKKIFGFGWKVLGIRFFTLIHTQGDNFFVGIFLGATALAFYAIGYQIYAIVTELITGALSAVALPTFSRMQEDHARLVKAILKATRISAALAVPFFLGTAVSAPFVIPFLFGNHWHSSIAIMQILALAGLLNCVMFFDRSALIAVGRVRMELGITAAATIGNVIAIVIGAQFGIKGVAIAITLRGYLMWPVRLLSLRVATGMSLRRYLAQWFQPVLCGLFGLLVAMGTAHLPIGILRYAIAAICGGLTYFLLMFVSARPTVQEIWELGLSILPKRRKEKVIDLT